MSPTDRPTRPLAALLLGLVVLACTGKAPPTTTPTGGASAVPSSGTAAATPHAVSVILPSTDAWLAVGRAGGDGLEIVLGSTGEHLFNLPSGVPDGTWSQLVTVAAKAKTTVVRALDVPELGGASQVIDGAWRLPTLGADPTPVGVSGDGQTIVLVADGAKAASGAAASSRFAILHRSLSGKPRFVTLQGSFEYDALSPDGAILYVVEHLPAPPVGHYQVRSIDTATGILRDGVVVDKTGLDEAMAGYPIAQARQPYGMVFTLYRGREHPFIHALNTVDAWALCIDLPATGADDATAALDWGLAATADGHTLVAANATLGLAAEIPLGDLAVRRSVTFAPAASTAITLAKFGHEAGGPVDRRVVVSPLGSTLYAAGRGGIVRLGMTDLAVTGRFLEGIAVDAVAVTRDGGTLYALVHAGGRIMKLDATTGKVEGTVPGGGFDRLVAVVPG